MTPVRKGQYLTVTVDETLYKEEVSALQDSMIGRIIHVKGDKPLGPDALITWLGDIWKIKTPWTMIPIGEGYYSIQFSCDGDKERIFTRRTWQLKPSVLRLQRWVPDFNPYRVTTSIVQAWIRISELPLEYWNKHIITSLVSAVGTVIKIDKRTLNKTMGHFARVFVELDLKHEREEDLMFERAGHCSFMGVQYERLPDFCKFCNRIGHITGHCGGNNNRQRHGKATATTTSTVQKGDEPKDSSKAPLGVTKQWVQRTFPLATNGNQAQEQTKDMGQDALPRLHCRNSFAILDEAIGEESDMMDSDNVVAEAAVPVAGVVTLSRDDQLQVQLPPIVEENVRKTLTAPPAEDVGIEEQPKGRKQKALLVAKEYNLQNLHGDEAARDETPTYRPGPGLLIPEDNSTRPLQTMHNITRER
ncbi:hypothetical protein ACS0TY_017368 [Phlomoides rotata]